MYMTEQHNLFRKLVAGFAEKELNQDLLDEIEETNHFPRDLLKKMADLGFMGTKIPKQWGGAGFDMRAYVILNEELAKVSAITAIYANTPNSLGAGPLLLSGTKEQLQKYLVPLAKGEKIICFGLTEPGAGSDAAGMTTQAVKDGKHYILNGRKCFITHAPEADYAIIFAKTDMKMRAKGISAFIMDMHLPGVSTGLPEKKMGLIGAPTGDIIMEDVRVHEEDMLGKENRGFINAMRTLDIGRIGIAGQALGVAQSALDAAIRYSKERSQFGRKLKEFQAISFMISEMATKLEAARLLTNKAAWLRDTNQDTTMAASMAKLFATETCKEICDKAIQIHGGYGYIKGYKVERYYRDSRVFTLYEGTSQVLNLIIAGRLLK
ncbi:MAG TPA: acyl-CoA dehydrogenase family protein [Anaerovoracaceae bacterium]|nr:acyl-CoA dehydrogenase family protein [Anaerovoracaceae bacterium]